MNRKGMTGSINAGYQSKECHGFTAGEFQHCGKTTEEVVHYAGATKYVWDKNEMIAVGG